MFILAEIADKMLSTSSIVLLAIVVAVASIVLALVHRVVAWIVLLVAFLAGVFLGIGGYHETFTEDAFSEAVWAELGWSWVVVSIFAPLAPSIAVSVSMVLRRSRAAR